jgi:hypothetical protein
MNDDTCAVYLYALIKATTVDLADVRGINSSAVRMLTRGQVGAVVGDVPLATLDLPDEELSEKGRLAELAVSHDAVIRTLFAQAPVLPLRLATVVPDDTTALRVLDECAPSALDRLSRLDGHAEWAVRLRRVTETPVDGQVDAPVDEPAAVQGTVPGGTPGRSDSSGSDTSGSDGHGSDTAGSPTRRSGTAYLQRRRNALRAAERRRDAEHALADRTHAAMAQHATEAAQRQTGHEDLLLNAAYLVDARRQDAFHAEADGQAALLMPDGVRLDVIGPWPPYSFAALDGMEVGHG